VFFKNEQRVERKLQKEVKIEELFRQEEMAPHNLWIKLI